MWGRAVRLGVLALLGAACGGKSAAAPDHERALAGSGGSSGSGESSTTTGGASTAGGVAATSSESCTAPREAGTCSENVAAWYYEASTGICRPFTYTGCGGNQNRYPSLEACQTSCRFATPAYDACSRNSDCVVVPDACCSECTILNGTRRNLIAYNRRYGALVESGADCVPLTNNLGYFAAECVENRCRVVDLLHSSASACSTADECVYHRGLGCCESCDAGSDVIGISRYGNFKQLTCTGDEACPHCMAPPVEHMALSCTDGFCRASPLLTP